MIAFQIGYRHNNGDVEGFKGFGFSDKSAEQDALNQIKKKVCGLFPKGFGNGFDPTKVIRERSQCHTLKEYLQIKKDWESNQRY